MVLKAELFVLRKDYKKQSRTIRSLESLLGHVLEVIKMIGDAHCGHMLAVHEEKRLPPLLGETQNGT